MRMSYLANILVILLGVTAAGQTQERKTRDQLVHEDLENVLQDGFWIYNDFEQARVQAEAANKPLLVVLRCIPCEACAQLDREVMERDPLIRRLMSDYVCLRIVYANGLDINLFQYDYDQSFAVFLMNSDKTIYGRYGTRSHQTESDNDVSLEGFAKALQAGLAIQPRLSTKQNDVDRETTSDSGRL